ncbi:MAG: hypothetical protein IPO92_18870 [Saprospiraceae bacterium]|nr:hypothetical protein [Saprospiraceae bacterium]
MQRIIFLYFVCILSLSHLSHTKGETTFISWNIKDFGQSRSDDQIKAIAQLIRYADIIAIKEVVAVHPGGAQAVGRIADPAQHQFFAVTERK